MRDHDQPTGLRPDEELLDPPTGEPFAYEGTHEPLIETRPPVTDAPSWDFNEAKLRSLLDHGQRAATIRALTQESVRDQQDALRRLRTRLENQRGTDGRVHIDAKSAAELARVEGELRRRQEEHAQVSREADPLIGLAGRLEQWARSKGWTPSGVRTKPMVPAAVDPSTGSDGWVNPARPGGA